MKILAIFKGFVTNSSSTNYWLNDGQLEPGEPGYSSSTPTTTSSAKPNNSSSTKNAPTPSVNTSTAETQTANTQTTTGTPYYQESSLQNLLIWGSFSLILILVILIKKFKK